MLSYNTHFEQNGITSPIYYGQNGRTEEINKRMENRYFPDTVIPPNFDPRPVSTRFCVLPMVDMRKQTTDAPTKITPDQTGGQFIYSPATSRAPPATFFRSVDLETQLRTGNTRSIKNIYIPSSNSDLYRVQITPSAVPCSANTTEIMPPFLFSSLGQYSKHIPSGLGNIGNDYFHNHTKTQLRDNRVNIGV